MTDTKDIESDPGFVFYLRVCESPLEKVRQEWAEMKDDTRAMWNKDAQAVIQAHERQAWRSVEEGLPGENGEQWLVMIHWPGCEPTMTSASYWHGTWWKNEAQLMHVTHYRPLPAPPTKGGE